MQEIYTRNNVEDLVDHSSLIQVLAGWIRPERYLELGVLYGQNFIKIAPYAKEAIAVDAMSLQFPLPANARYEHMTTDEYFEKIKNTNIMFDMVFIDADHSFEQSFKDFINVKDRVIDDGFVILHDTYPCCAKMVHPHFTGESYKTPIAIKKEFGNEWELVTLPFNPGITVAKKVRKERLPWMT